MTTLLCCACYDKNKQILYFSDYNKNITHVQINKMFHVSFKTFLKHKLAQ